MPNLNKVMLMGNLTRDPEVRYTPKGMAVTDVGMAVNRRYKVENEVREEVTFVDITFWGKQAEVIGQWMKKGRPLYVEGRLQLDSWDDKQTGKKQYKLRIVGEEFQFLGGPREEGGGGGGSQGGSGGYRSEDSYDEAPPARSSSPPQRQAAPQQARQDSEAFPAGLDDEDEIPF
jgi:single-strand DNA-binding protein